MFCLHLQIVMWWLIYYLHILCIFFKRAELNSVINKLEDPPRLIFVKGDKGFCNTYIIGGGTQIEVSKDLRKALTLLLFAYYVWDLAYPKYYQLLGFLQVYILGDKENKFSMSQNYLKFTKMFDDLNVWAYHKRYTQRIFIWTQILNTH